MSNELERKLGYAEFMAWLHEAKKCVKEEDDEDEECDTNDKKTKNKIVMHDGDEDGTRVTEELKGNQHKLDKNKNGRLDAHDFELLRKEEEELDEAIKLNSKVTIHDPGKSHHGKVGYVGEIRHGAYKGAPKTYTVDYDHDEETGRAKSIQLDKKNIKTVKEEAELDESWMSKRSSYDGPGKGKLLGNMSEKEHVDAINYHGNQIHQLKTGTHKYSKMYTKQQAADKLAQHMKHYTDHKDAYDAHTMKEEAELDEGIKSVVHSYLAKHAGKKADDAYDMGDEKEFQKQVDKSEYHRVKAGGKPTRINTDPDAKFLTTREEVELDEALSKDDKASIALQATVARQKLKDIEKSGKNKSQALIDKLTAKANAGKRLTKEELELDEMKPLPRRHFFKSFGVEGHGIAHDGKENHWKFENNKPVAHTKDPEVVAGWKRDLAAKSRANEEVDLDEEQKIKVSDIKAALKNVKNASDHTKKMIKANPTQKMPHDSSRHAAYSEEFELDEAFKPGDKVTYETSKYSKDNKGVVHSVDGEHVTIKGHDMLGKPHHIEIHQGFVKKIKEEVKLDEEKIPVQHVTDAVHKVLGQKSAVGFLNHLRPGTEKHTSWDKVNDALVKQGVKSQHIASIASHVKPAQYEEFELDEGQKVKTATGYVHKGSYGSDYDTDEEGTEKKKAAPEVKRSRGRPKKGSDETGEVKKYTFHDLLNRLSR